MYPTYFGGKLSLDSEANVKKALQLFKFFIPSDSKYKLHREDDDVKKGFDVEEGDDDTIRILSSDGQDYNGEQYAAEYVELLGKELNLKGKWGFTWACVDTTGGAFFFDFDNKKTERVYNRDWLQAKLNQ